MLNLPTAKCHILELSFYPKDTKRSFRALSAAARVDIGAGAALSLLQQLVAETKQVLQIVALDDRRALSSVGHVSFTMSHWRSNVSLSNSILRFHSHLRDELPVPHFDEPWKITVRGCSGVHDPTLPLSCMRARARRTVARPPFSVPVHACHIARYPVETIQTQMKPLTPFQHQPAITNAATNKQCSHNTQPRT